MGKRGDGSDPGLLRDRTQSGASRGHGVEKEPPPQPPTPAAPSTCAEHLRPALNRLRPAPILLPPAGCPAAWRTAPCMQTRTRNTEAAPSAPPRLSHHGIRISPLTVLLSPMRPPTMLEIAIPPLRNLTLVFSISPFPLPPISKLSEEGLILKF